MIMARHYTPRQGASEEPHIAHDVRWMSVGDPNIPITSDPKRICQGRPSDVLSGCLFEVYNGRPSDVYWVPI